MEFWSDYGAFLLKTLTLLGAFLVVLGAIVSSSLKTKAQELGELKITKLNDVLEDFKTRMSLATLDKEAFKARQKAKAQAEKKARKEAKKAAKLAAKLPDTETLEAKETDAIEASKEDEPTQVKTDVPSKAKDPKSSEATTGGSSEAKDSEAKDSEPRDTKSDEFSELQEEKRRVYVLTFEGDKKASALEHLSQEITAILSHASSDDEVVLRLESPGGMVHTYGLAASQLQRIRDKGLQLTVCVDKVAASGGYMMAVVGQKILAAPFAIIGSIGVVAQLPNVHRLLKKNDVDVELFTAGEYKRTVTVLGENTEKGRQKFQQDLEDTHDLFKGFVKQQRPELDIDSVADGDIWYGSQALERKLVDGIQTSDQYLMECCEQADVYEIEYERKKTLAEKLGMAAETSLNRVVTRWLTRHRANDLIS